jgi:Sortilin, neurotensin receptor 3,
LDQFTPQEIKLPIQSLEQHTYTVLDTTEGQIFLSVSHNEENQKLTNIYVSDYRGFRFALSLLHNVRSLDTGNCDFERILGIEGVYIANVFDHNEVEKLRGRDNTNTKLLD